MIDIHYHLLHGVDDGPKDLSASLALAKASIEEGVTHIVATPHASYQYNFNPAINQAKLAEIILQLEGRATIGLGCDFHLIHENISDAFAHPAKYTVNGGNYLLVEIPEWVIPAHISRVLDGFLLRGIVPIVTHPERNPALINNPEILGPWIRSGCLVQVTAASLMGQFGELSNRACHHLLKNRWVHIIASDAHHIKSRPPMMRPAYEALKKTYGVETADRLCVLNPRAIFDGLPLPEQPAPLAFDESMHPRRFGILPKFFSR